jgi:hypothetical protein
VERVRVESRDTPLPVSGCRRADGLRPKAEAILTDVRRAGWGGVRAIGLGLLAVVVSACTAESGPGDEGGPGEDVAEVSLAGKQEQGERKLGAQLTGYEDPTLVPSGILYTSASLDGVPLANLRVEYGGLVAGPVLSVTTPSMVPCAIASKSSLSRSCGWRAAAIGACTPGATVHLGAGACGGFGACTGDSMLRVCAGEASCEDTSSTRIGRNDDACGSSCSDVTFTCPSAGANAGRFTVMAAAHSFSGWAGVTLAVENATLATILNGPELENAHFVGKAKPLQGPEVDVTYSIKVVEADGNLPGENPSYHGSTWLYTVKQQDPVTGNLHNACASVKSGQLEGDVRAIPIAATWDEEGNRTSSGPLWPRFSFACSSGVIAKCYQWGYKPWISATMEEVHQSCTRLASADYCGDGVTHTVDGTPINVWDIASTPPVQVQESLGMQFEAGWNPTGAVCLSKLRWRNLCLANLSSSFCVDKDNFVAPGFNGLCEVTDGDGCDKDRGVCPPPANPSVCDSVDDALAEDLNFGDPPPMLFNESNLNPTPPSP